MLDFWAKGSGLTSISLYFKDSATNTLSKDVRFQRADQLQPGVFILENDDDGFIHFRVELNALRGTDNSTYDGKDSCGTGVSQHFDRVVFADISGMGFNLVLDAVKLISKDAVTAASFFLPAMATRPPIFGDDLTNLKAAGNRYTMKLKRNVTYDAVSLICKELAGQIKEPQRFAGSCNTPILTVSVTLSVLVMLLTTVWLVACVQEAQRSAAHIILLDETDMASQHLSPTGPCMAHAACKTEWRCASTCVRTRTVLRQPLSSPIGSCIACQHLPPAVAPEQCKPVLGHGDLYSPVPR